MSDEHPIGEVTQLIEKWLKLQANGSELSVEELCAASPALIDQVRRELTAIRKMDEFLAESETSTKSSIGERTGKAESQNNYVLQQLLGYGGCSEVYLAKDTKLGRCVALKFLRPDTRDSAKLHQRLKREAEITSQLNHPGIVAIHSAGETDGTPFYSMQYIEGDSLAETISTHHRDARKSSGNFIDGGMRRLLKHLVDVCQTIAFAHENGVIHRDLKPANIVTGRFGETYVIDWGLARHFERSYDREIPVDSREPKPPAGGNDDNSKLTQLGHALGTPAYMSPEQVNGDTVGAPSDIFNLGATLYCILVGHAPYHSDSIATNLNQAKSATFEHPRTIAPRIPAALAAICCKAMAARPLDRYPSAMALASDVEDFLADQPVTAMPTPWVDRLRRWLQKHRTAVTTTLATALIGLVLLAIGNSLLLQSNRKLSISEASARQSLYAQRIAVANSEIENNNIVRARELLQQCPPESRRWEWHLLNNLIERHQPLVSLDFPGDQIRTIALDPAGDRLAAGDNTGTVKIWSTHNWKLLHEFDALIAVRKIAFVPGQDKLLAVGRRRSRPESRLTMLTLNSGQVEKKKIDSQSITALAITSDGKNFVTGELSPSGSSRIIIYDTQSMIPLHRIEDAHSDQINDLTINDQTEILACGADAMVTRWTMDGKSAGATQANNASVLSLDAVSDLIATAGSDNIVKTWRASTESTELLPLQSFAGHSDHVLSARLSPDQRFLATSGMDRDIHIWDLQSKRLAETIKRHSSHVRCLAFHPYRPLLFSGGEDRVVNVWDTERLSLLKPEGWNVDFTLGESEKLVVCDGKVINIWDALQQRPVVRISDHPAPILGITAGNDLVASCYFNGRCRLWNAANGNLIGEFGDPEAGAIFDAEIIGNDNYVALLHHRHTIEIVDLVDAQNSFQLKTKQRPYRLSASADGRMLVVATKNGSLEVFDLVRKSPIAEIQVGDKYLLGLCINPVRSHEVAVAAIDGSVTVLDLDSRQPVCRIQSGSSWLNCLAYTPDGQRIVAGNEHTMICFDADSGQEIVSMTMPRCVHEIAFNRDGSRLALASGPREGVPRQTKPPYVHLLHAGKAKKGTQLILGH